MTTTTKIKPCTEDVYGLHKHVLDEGGGMMSDCYVCVDCGIAKYPEVFPGTIGEKRTMRNMLAYSTTRREREICWEDSL